MSDSFMLAFYSSTFLSLNPNLRALLLLFDVSKTIIHENGGRGWGWRLGFKSRKKFGLSIHHYLFLAPGAKNYKVFGNKRPVDL